MTSFGQYKGIICRPANIRANERCAPDEMDNPNYRKALTQRCGRMIAGLMYLKWSASNYQKCSFLQTLRRTFYSLGSSISPFFLRFLHPSADQLTLGKSSP